MLEPNGSHLEERNIGFNEGCDARLMGEPLSWNPYPPNSTAAWGWRMGWKDVDENWGRNAKWGTFKELPKIVGEKKKK